MHTIYIFKNGVPIPVRDGGDGTNNIFINI